jgi:N-carbamoyl-L-amino-acid hydrolase
MMPSGAGHDIAIVASQKKCDGKPIPSLLIFIPCLNGVSHNPKEFTTDEAMQKGAVLIANALAELVA